MAKKIDWRKFNRGAAKVTFESRDRNLIVFGKGNRQLCEKLKKHRVTRHILKTFKHIVKEGYWSQEFGWLIDIDDSKQPIEPCVGTSCKVDLSVWTGRKGAKLIDIHTHPHDTGLIRPTDGDVLSWLLTEHEKYAGACVIAAASKGGYSYKKQIHSTESKPMKKEAQYEIWAGCYNFTGIPQPRSIPRDKYITKPSDYPKGWHWKRLDTLVGHFGKNCCEIKLGEV